MRDTIEHVGPGRWLLPPMPTGDADALQRLAADWRELAALLDAEARRAASEVDRLRRDWRGPGSLAAPTPLQRLLDDTATVLQSTARRSRTGRGARPRLAARRGTARLVVAEDHRDRGGGGGLRGGHCSDGRQARGLPRPVPLRRRALRSVRQRRRWQRHRPRRWSPGRRRPERCSPWRSSRGRSRRPAPSSCRGLCSPRCRHRSGSRRRSAQVSRAEPSRLVSTWSTTRTTESTGSRSRSRPSSAPARSTPSHPAVPAASGRMVDSDYERMSTATSREPT